MKRAVSAPSQRAGGPLRPVSLGVLLACLSLSPATGLADGADGGSTRAARSQRQPMFGEDVAPLLATHCLDCHNASTQDGGLDLSRQKTAFAGGDSGEAIVPADSDRSLLWFYVESDEMPRDRAPLSDDQKQILRRWIDSGAARSLEEPLDTDAYLHEKLGAGNWVRRLTVPEYIETVRSAVGVDIAREARRILPPNRRADGFTNTAYNLASPWGTSRPTRDLPGSSSAAWTWRASPPNTAIAIKPTSPACAS